jgi:hypothetical protein
MPMDNVEKIEITLPARKFKAHERGILWRNRLNTPGVHPGAQGLLPAEASTMLRTVAAYIDLNIDPFPADSNMQLALELAEELAPVGPLPPSLQAMSAEQRMDLILDAVPLAPRDRLPLDLGDHAPFVQIARLFGTVAARSAAAIPDVGDSLARIGILLRMWSAFLMTQKTLADETRSGTSTENYRATMSREIDRLADRDPAYEAGIEPAIVKRLRDNDSISFDGVQPGTRVDRLRRYVPGP